MTIGTASFLGNKKSIFRSRLFLMPQILAGEGSSLLLAPVCSQEIIGTKKTLTSLVLQSGRQRQSLKRYPPSRMKYTMGRVDAYIDNTNLLDFWNNGGGKNISLTNEIKDLFFLSLKLNIDLKMFYIPSKLNDADTPSRFSSDSDCSLSNSAWNLLEDSFDPDTFDLMAIPSSVRRSKHGGKLNFFSPFPFKESFGVNVFAQSLSFEENYYVFPPFLLVGPLIRFLREGAQE